MHASKNVEKTRKIKTSANSKVIDKRANKGYNRKM